MNTVELDLLAMQSGAANACRLMKVLSNPDRLLLLCQLSQGEKRVGELEEIAGISEGRVLALVRSELATSP